MTTAPAPSTPRALKSLPGPRPLPLVGNMLQMKPTTAHLQLEEWARAYGELYCCYFGPRPGLVLCRPEEIRRILQLRPATFRRPSKLAEVLASLKMVGVFGSEGEEWRRQRKLLNVGLSPSHVETFYPALATITQRLTDELAREGRAGASVDVLRVVTRYTVDVTSMVSFGVDMDTLQKGSHPLQQHIGLLLPALQQRILAPFPYWKLLPSARKIDHALAETYKAVMELVERSRRDLEREPERATKPRTVLEALVAARDEEGGGARFTDEELFANILLLLAGGEDTTASTITWMLHYLAAMPEVQARARQEVDSVVSPGVVPTMEHIRQMPYLAGVAQEVLRLRASAPLVYLEALEDTVVADVAVPKGSMVIALTRLLGQNDAAFGDAKSFRPERWLPQLPPDIQAHSPRQMLQFGLGGKMCPGRSLALLECALAPCAVLRRFELELVDPNATVQEVNDFSVMPKGVNLRFKPRASAARA